MHSHILKAAVGIAVATGTTSAAMAPVPQSVDVQGTILVSMEKILKDPQSARYRYVTTTRSRCTGRALDASRKAPKEIWIVAFEVNAKNSYGAYPGFQPYFLWVIPDGEAFRTSIYDDGGQYIAYSVAGCREISD